MRLIAENLACVRGGRRLFDGLGFVLSGGEALAVRGPNGAGKSSLLRLIAGLLRPAEGRLVLEGTDAEAGPGAVAHFVGHLDGVKASLTVAENLDFVCALLGGAGGRNTRALEAFGLARLADFPAGMLSAGQRRRLALARLLAVARPLWLLDEPLTSLDAEGQEAFAAVANQHLADGGLIVAATHAPLGISAGKDMLLGGTA